MIRTVVLRLDCTPPRIAAIALLAASTVAYGQDVGSPVAVNAAEEPAAAEPADPPPASESFPSSQPQADMASPAASEPGSFFRAAPPRTASSFAADDSAQTGAVADPGAETGGDPGGMSRFGSPLPSAPIGTAPTAGVPTAQPPLQTPLPPPAAGETSRSAASTVPPVTDGTRSVLTSPPAAMDSQATGSLNPPAAFPPPSEPFSAAPTAGNLQPPAAFDASGGVSITSSGSGGSGSAAGIPDTSSVSAESQQQPTLPSGPATSLIDAAIEAVEPGTGPAVLAGLAERPLPLLEALERSGDRGRRLWITQAYWKVVEQAAVLRWTAEAAERLDLVAPSGDPHDRATLDVAVASRLADVAAARAALVSAQQELVDLVRLPATEALPWPVDRPLATSYETHFDVLFASRIATGRIRAIHRSLPLEHQEVDARAAAVLAAETAVEMAENDHARGARGIESVIAAHAALLEQQKALAKAVTRYNDDIVEYVMAVADFSVPDDQFATMLIGAPTPWRPAVALTSATVPTGGVPTLAPPPAATGSQPAAAGGFPVR